MAAGKPLIDCTESHVWGAPHLASSCAIKIGGPGVHDQFF